MAQFMIDYERKKLARICPRARLFFNALSLALMAREIDCAPARAHPS